MTRKLLSRLLLLTLGLAPATAHAAERHMAFVTCPIVRDTSTVPCWLAEHEGELYYLGIQVDSQNAFRPPMLGHKVLVEGVPQPSADGIANAADLPSGVERVCGGIPLVPVQISGLPELSPECQAILPAEARYELPFTPPRPPGPGRRPLVFISTPAPPEPPFQPKTFNVPYDFDSLVDSRHTRWFRNIAAYARDTGARRISIIGMRAAIRLSNGECLVENTDVGERRAKEMHKLLQGGSLPDLDYEIDWQELPCTGDGPMQRITRVTVIP
jgi:hypothetical protein